MFWILSMYRAKSASQSLWNKMFMESLREAARILFDHCSLEVWLNMKMIVPGYYSLFLWFCP